MAPSPKNVLVTGGLGFIGSHFVEKALREGHRVINLDALTYAAGGGNKEAALSRNKELEAQYPGRYYFVQGSIVDFDCPRWAPGQGRYSNQFEVGEHYLFDGTSGDGPALLRHFAVDWMVNLSAYTHDPGSIGNPGVFMQVNKNGAISLMVAAEEYWLNLISQWKKMPEGARKNELKEKIGRFRFLQASTDKVYGALPKAATPFTEASPYNPTTPYGVSKYHAEGAALNPVFAGASGFPVIITNSANVFGPGQHGEKLIPGTIERLLNNKRAIIYGDGQNIRDWVYVDDECELFLLALNSKRSPGQKYNISAECELRTIDVVRMIGRMLEELAQQNIIKPRADGKPYNDQSLIEYQEARPGDDRREALSSAKARRELGWVPEYDGLEGFREALRITVEHAAHEFMATQRSTELSGLDEALKGVDTTLISGGEAVQAPHIPPHGKRVKHPRHLS